MSTKSTKDVRGSAYPVRIEFDREDDAFVAEFPDLPGCSAAGATVQEAYDRAQKAKDEWLRVASNQGLPIPSPSTKSEYSGRVLLRLPTSLHAMLTDKAQLHGTSLNQYLVYLLSAGAVGDEFTSRLQELASQLSRLDFRVGQLSVEVKQLSPYPSQSFGLNTQIYAHEPAISGLGGNYVYGGDTDVSRRLTAREPEIISFLPRLQSGESRP